MGELTPGQGTIEFGTNLEIARFDQLHGELDEDLTLAQNICGDGDTVMVNGHQRHINGYLQDFLFDNEQIRGPIWNLSGGERNRLALAKVLSRPSNVLVLDEPTNDLDLETLEVLESLLAEYAGTLIIVSHDREFLNNTVTSMVLFEGPDEGGVGVVREYVGGYDDALAQQANLVGQVENAAKSEAPKGARVRLNQAQKLSFKEAKELKALPGQIEKIEAEIGALQEAMAEPDFYRQGGEVIAREQGALEGLEAKLEAAMEKWEALESIQSGESQGPV